MRKKLSRFAAWLLTLGILAVCLSGCWDYKGLRELTVVAGIALDQSDNAPNVYSLSFEIVDSTTPPKEQADSVMITSEGRTIFEAVNNANKQLHNEMYFGNTDIIVVSRQLAETVGIDNIFDAFLRDYNTRDSLLITISRELTAKELLESPEDENRISSYFLSDSLIDSTAGTNFTRAYKLFEVYNLRMENAGEIMLPALRFEDKEKKLLRTDGMALFKKDKLTGFLADEDMPGLIFATEKLSGGHYVAELDKVGDYLTADVISSKPKLGFRYESGRLTLTSFVNVLARVVEVDTDIKEIHDEEMEFFEQKACESMVSDITKVIKKMQAEREDIFLFGREIFRKDPRLWDTLKDDWDTRFSQAEVEVSCEFLINDTGMIRGYYAEGVS
ncbi:MAG TPA: hypothetical protein DEQ02_01765 [Ruminococcaceae bacterium]|nr:hypothetical protein [Oscillospiraceae bacterium]